jgi:hypothetical protein
VTCIAGIVDANGKILMAADSAGVGITDWSVRVRADRKLFIREKMIFGFTTVLSGHG